MGKLVKNGTVVADDDWQSPGDETPLPDGKVVLSTQRLLREGKSLTEQQRPLGVRLEAGEEVEALAEFLPALSLVVLVFETFTDGRHYSTARLLRDRYGFKGEIRAVGDVLRDQLLYMNRCGIDAFELRDDQDPTSALKALGEFTVKYQPAVDERLHIFRRRSLTKQPESA